MPVAESGLAGKVVVITGAAGGIGSATARALAAAGAIVVAADVDGAAAKSLARSIGGGAIPRPLDVCDLDAFTALLDDVADEVGPVDALINNAGVMPLAPFTDLPATTVRRMVQINLVAVMHGTAEAGRRMLDRGRGHIVNVASSAGLLSNGGAAAYCGSKFGVIGFSESVALELAGTGVNLSVVCPGAVRTRLSTGVETPGLRTVEPEEIGTAIVEVLRRPRFMVLVPRTLVPAVYTYGAIPHGLRHRLLRRARLDRLMLGADRQARAGYEDLIAQPAEGAGRESLAASSSGTLQN
jgi:NAD(P)-dependent dehydrogenase (short-subunit alcohol dehydrogenase family)